MRLFVLSICPETITEKIRLQFLKRQITLHRQKLILPEAQAAQLARNYNTEITHSNLM